MSGQAFGVQNNCEILMRVGSLWRPLKEAAKRRRLVQSKKDFSKVENILDSCHHSKVWTFLGKFLLVLLFQEIVLQALENYRLNLLIVAVIH